MQILVEDRRTVEAGVALGVPYIVISIHDPTGRSEIPQASARWCVHRAVTR